MDAAGCGGGSGGPAPFLLKTYEMVDDSGTDEIVSWSSLNNSFVVWNPPEFSRILLPTYFKHNNFSSFIRQLNTYGFRKIDPERWEFANEHFVKDQKHLLKNIHRRKPIHSHSHPPGSVDPERAAFQEELDRLSRDKANLEANILRFKQQKSAAKLHLENITQKVESMEKRQESLISFLEKAMQNPTFVEHLARKVESLDVSAYNKKRRLPQADSSPPEVEIGFEDNHSTSRSEFGNMFQKDFSNKLRLELSPTVSDVNMVSHSTQSSNADGESPQRNFSEGESRGGRMRTNGFDFATETLDLSDTGTSFMLRMDASVPRKSPSSGIPLQPSMTSTEDGESLSSCHLSLTLASSSLQVKNAPCSSRTSQLYQEGKSSDSRINSDGKDSDVLVSPKSKILVEAEKNLSSSQEPQDNNQRPAAPPARVNDVFWEQFLTERPGCSDNEEASSSYRADQYDGRDDGMAGRGMYQNAKNIGGLSL